MKAKTTKTQVGQVWESCDWREKGRQIISTWEKTMGFDADQHGKRVAPVSQCSAEELRWVRGVAQPGSAPRLGRGGRRFKSSHPDHFGRLYGGA